MCMWFCSVLSPNSVEVTDSSPLRAFQFLSRKKIHRKNRKRDSSKIELVSGLMNAQPSSIPVTFLNALKENFYFQCER